MYLFAFGKSWKAIDKVPSGIMNERHKRVRESSEFIFIKEGKIKMGQLSIKSCQRLKYYFTTHSKGCLQERNGKMWEF